MHFETAHSKGVTGVFFESADATGLSGEMKAHGRTSDLPYVLGLLIS
jgi:hypothetical protein